PAQEGRRGRKPISAFIVETAWPGVETVHRCDFMGLKGISNGVLRFTDVKVPVENLLWGEGKGLKLALVTLNTGRLTIPATSVAAGKWCLQVARTWAAEREQWGAPIGKHDAIAQKLGSMAAQVFAMEAVAELSAALADKGDYDIRLEAAIAKMYNSEMAWRIGDETLQIRGGRGYETAESLASRGEAAIPVEQVLRDLRINMIFEGSSEIMRLFIAREAVDPHVQKAEALANPDSSLGEKARDAVGLGTHMAGWVSSNVVGWSRWPRHDEFGELSAHVGYADRAARKLARTLAYVMARHGLKLEKKQAVLGRIVDAGAELFAIAATCSFAVRESNRMGGDQGPIILAKLFCKQARRRAEEAFDAVTDNDDSFTYGVAQDVLAGRYAWLEKGIIEPPRDLSVS
ncbi:MAG TPA: acyl-CoA dehydrogenase, partial [Longimicrobiales bacterium]|nr:acyl-CoA dehydrogenase [Longimicrobiales bacterium]